MKKKVQLHRNLMLVALGLGVLFLISYITYHSNIPSVVFGDANFNGILDESESMGVGSSRNLYLLVLLSHIFFSVVAVPLILMALYFAITEQFPKHKRIVRFAYPVWLYVSLTGVIVYFMIRPYYFQ